MMELEICVDSVESAIAAEAGGAQRVELCSALTDGGLTPSAGLLRAVLAQVHIGVYVMIRPRAGDFFYTEQEWVVMRDDILFAQHSGAHGVVFGLLDADGSVDIERTSALVDLARPMEVTFHRAIDMSRSIEQSLMDVIQTGADRVLTSGGAQNAILGSACIHRLVAIGGNSIKVMAGGGIRPGNLQHIAGLTGAREFHAALRSPVSSPVNYKNKNIHLGEPGRDEYARTTVSVEDVRRLRDAMNAAVASSASKTAVVSA